MADCFRPVVREQLFLMPPSMADWLPDDHEVWFVIDLVEGLDLSEIEGSYRLGAQGRAPFSPSMLLTLLVYAYSGGLKSSRAIERACSLDVAFRVICGNDAPDHTTIARFRQRHLDVVEKLFVEVLSLCGRAGLVQVGTVSLDGTKMRGDASLGANRSVERLREVVAERLAEAAEIDAAEDEELGDRRGDEMPAGLVDRAARAERIAELLAEAGVDEDTAGEDKVNMTDPDSRVMSSTRGKLQGYNAQAICGDGQIVLATGVTNEANDYSSLVPMLDELAANLSAAGVIEALGCMLADAGYFSAANMTELDTRGIDALIATRRRGAQPVEPPSVAEAEADLEAALVAWRAEIDEIDAAQRAERQRRADVLDAMAAKDQTPKDVTEELGVCQATAYRNASDYRNGGVEAIRMPRRQRPPRPKHSDAAAARIAMEHRLADPANAARYKRRSHQIETYFGNLKANKRIVGFTRRGLRAATTEWEFMGLVNNITKLRSGLNGLFATMNPAI